MIRLVLLLAPSASVSAAIALNMALSWSYNVLTGAKQEAVVVEVETKKKGKFVKSKTITELAREKYYEITGTLNEYPTLKAAIAVILVVLVVNALYLFLGHAVVMSEVYM
tara:strand:- start:533 stop:862 length:330 start_codon:yes stop_codon:yes gene_type:complete